MKAKEADQKNEKKEFVEQYGLDTLLDNRPQKHKSSRITNSGKGSEDSKTILFLGELALGTNGSNPKVYKGLNYFIKANRLSKKIGHVVINGGLIPRIPNYFGLQNEREMAFLASDWEKEIDTDMKKILDSNIPGYDKKFIKKWVAYKIENTNQALHFSRKSLKDFAKTLDDSVWHYIHGEEDQKNITELMEINIENYIATNQRNEKFETKLEELASEKENLDREKENYKTKVELLKKIQQNISVKSSEDYIKEYIGNFLNQNKKEIETLDNSSSFVKEIGNLTHYSVLKENLEKINSELKQLRTKEKEVSAEIRENKTELNAIKRENVAPQFFRITKRRAITPKDAAYLRKSAKDEYNSQLYDIFPSFPDKQYFVHSGNEVDLILDGVHVNLAHKPQIRSNVPGANDMRKTVEKSKLKNKRGHDVPDISVTAHGSGGFKAKPIPKYSEEIESGKKRETPELHLIMQQPTLQCVNQLTTIAQKNVKNHHTVRPDKPFSSGVVLYTKKKSGEVITEMISHNTLMECADIGEEIERLKEIDKQSKRKSKARTNKIANLESKLKLNTKKGTIITDVHFGSPNTPERPTNYSVFESSKKYIEQNGIPDLLVVNGDIVHGVLKHFGSNEQYLGKLPKELNDKINEIKQSGKKQYKKIEALEELLRGAYAHNPIPIVDDQLKEVKDRLVPLMQKVLSNNGYVVITSGNHGNDTSKYYEEAKAIRNLLDKEYVDHPKLVVNSSPGDKYATGEKVLSFDNGDISAYFSHGPMKGEEIAGALKQITGTNRRPHLAFFGHVHQAASGHADGSFVTIGAGMQTHNQYVERVGMTPSLRGIVNIEFDPSKKGYCKWTYVLDPVLESKQYAVKG